MKKLFLFAAAALALASCSETDELSLDQVPQKAEQKGIQFDVYTSRAVSRAGAAGGVDEEGKYGVSTKSLKVGAHKAGFGVFAYYTGNGDFDTNSSTPNFMYNQQVKWSNPGDAVNGVWTYEPVKYWPNEFGGAAQSEDFDKVSFFAYAPWVPFTVNKGVPVVGEGEQASVVQKKNIVGTVKNTTSGNPYIKYVVDTDPSTSVDLLWGVAADKNGYRGLNYEGIEGDGNVIPGNCYVDLTKQVGTTDSVKWNFKHALAQLNVQIIQAVDTETEGSAIYKPGDNPTAIGTMGSNVDKLTKVYLRWIEFNGFAMEGALDLHSDDVLEPGVANAEPKWKGIDGAKELTFEPVRFDDGLKDGIEGTTNNKQKLETRLGLNPAIIEESAEAEGAATWADKKVGVPYAEYTNLFEGAVTASDPIYVIPSYDRLTIELCYDVETQDEQLITLLSDNKTHGSAIENKISKYTDVIIEAGKAYTIKIVVGMESVKVNVKVTDWIEHDPKDVDMPYNPGYQADVTSYTVSAASADEDMGTAATDAAAGKVEEGTVVTFTATPASGYEFTAWTDADGHPVSTANPYSVAIDADTELTAQFQGEALSIGTRYTVTCTVDGFPNSIALQPGTTLLRGVYYYNIELGVGPSRKIYHVKKDDFDSAKVGDTINIYKAVGFNDITMESQGTITFTGKA